MLLIQNLSEKYLQDVRIVCSKITKGALRHSLFCGSDKVHIKPLVSISKVSCAGKSLADSGVNRRKMISIIKSSNFNRK